MDGFGALVLSPVAPAAALVVAALAILVSDWFLPSRDIRPPAAMAIVGLVVSLVVVWRQWVAFAGGSVPGEASTGLWAPATLVTVDAFGLFVEALLVTAALLVALVSVEAVERHDLARAEYFVLLLTATAGMLVFCLATDLVLLFLCLEAFSIALYVLCAFKRGDRSGQEAGVKYFVLGAVAAGFLLYGIALVYGSAGTTQLTEIGAYTSEHAEHVPGMLYAGIALLVVGLGFKIAMVPFHQWTPDVYEGAPTSVTAFMSAATKAAAFAVVLRVMWTAFPSLSGSWAILVAALAVLTIVVGNLAALVQSDLKRMLAYSAVAHAGYLLVAVAVGTPEALSAALFYLLVYAVMNIGAFAVLIGMGRVDDPARDATSLDDVRGLARLHPGLALALSVFLFSLTGLPPTAGFLAKWYLFRAAIGAESTWLAVAIALGSVVSAFYYLRPVIYMVMFAPSEEREIEVPTGTAVAVATTAAVVALALLLAGPLADASVTAGQVGEIRVAAPPAEEAEPMFFSPPMFEKGRTTSP